MVLPRKIKKEIEKKKHYKNDTTEHDFRIGGGVLK